ncbi:MAG TPA: hypothetical protein VIX90_01880 [Edaphobacter sp.]
MDDAENKGDWRGYAAWGSLLCGILGLVFTIAISVYVDFGQKHSFDPWESRYLFLTVPISFLGVILGAIGKETPRIAGLVLSACILLRVIGASVAM